MTTLPAMPAKRGANRARRAQRTGEQMTPAARVASLNTVIDARLAAMLAGLPMLLTMLRRSDRGRGRWRSMPYRNGSVLMVRVA
jgi:hypothetical protein